MAINKGYGLLAVIMLSTFLTAQPYAANKEKLSASIRTQDATEKAAAKSQVKIDKIADDAEQLLAEYKLAIRQYETLNTYNNHVQKIVNSQQQELDSIAGQLGEVDNTDRGVIPLMDRMISSLDQFVALDSPFLKDEREKRIANLKALLDRADITVSEKYRRVLEAYQVEVDYGRTIESYEGTIEQNGKNLAVNFLRVGRVVLLYQTLDRKQTAMWNKGSRKWEALPEEYKKSVTRGLQIARKQAAPDLLKLPVMAPEKL